MGYIKNHEKSTTKDKAIGILLLILLSCFVGAMGAILAMLSNGCIK